MKAVYDWVTRNTRYVALEFGIYGYKPRRCVQTVTRGWGDCKDKATVIVTLLKELGIPATFVVVRTQMQRRASTRRSRALRRSITPSPTCRRSISTSTARPSTRAFSELPRMDIGARRSCTSNEGKTTHHDHPRAASGQELRRAQRARPRPEERRGQALARLPHGRLHRGRVAAAVSGRIGAPRAPEPRSRRRAPRVRHRAGRAGHPDEQPRATPRSRCTCTSKARRRASRAARAISSRWRSRIRSGSPRRTPRSRSAGRTFRFVAFSELRDTFTVELPPGAKIVSAPEPAAGDGRFGWYSVTVDKQGDKITVKSRLGLKVTRVVPKDYAAFKLVLRGSGSRARREAGDRVTRSRTFERRRGRPTRHWFGRIPRRRLRRRERASGSRADRGRSRRRARFERRRRRRELAARRARSAGRQAPRARSKRASDSTRSRPRACLPSLARAFDDSMHGRLSSVSDEYLEVVARRARFEGPERAAVRVARGARGDRLSPRRARRLETLETQGRGPAQDAGRHRLARAHRARRMVGARGERRGRRRFREADGGASRLRAAAPARRTLRTQHAARRARAHFRPKPAGPGRNAGRSSRTWAIRRTCSKRPARAAR